MPKRTWTQHDFSAHLKDGLSQILRCGGLQAYGAFWLLQERLGLQNQAKIEPTNTLKIPLSNLAQLWKCQHKTVFRILETFRDHSGSVPITFRECSRNVLEITLPNSLVFIRKRILKTPNIELNIERDFVFSDKGEEKAPESAPEPTKKELKKMEKSPAYSRMMRLQVKVMGFSNWPGGQNLKRIFLEALNSDWLNVQDDDEAGALDVVLKYEKEFKDLLLQ